jgi:phage baseplate assembly protein gpV
VVDNQTEAQKVAGAIADRLAGEEIQVRGEIVGNPDLGVGHEVTIGGVGTLNGTYVVTGVEHVFGQDLAFTTRFRAGGGDPAGLPELVGGRSASALPSSLVIGIVTNNNDPENLGRVKVKFPTLSDTEESNWARVLTIASGSSHGIQVLPEVNDEVLVAFENGDVRHPVVIGGLYSGKNKPPLTSSESVKQNRVASWLLKSRTGNTLQFLDGQGAQQATVLMRHANTQNLLRVTDDRIELLGKAGAELSIKIGNSSISISKNGDIVLDGTNITLKARQNINLQANVALEAKGNTSAKLAAGPASIEAGPSGAAVKGGPMVQIQGVMVKVG